MAVYFKNRYALAFYTEEDELRYLFDNIYDIQTFLKDTNKKISYNKLYFSLYYSIKHKKPLKIFKKETLYCYLIDMKEEEDNYENDQDSKQQDN